MPVNSKSIDGFVVLGVIEKVVETFLAIVKMLDSGDRLKIDQDELETVIPQIGGTVKIVNGEYRGEVGTLLAVDQDKFAARVKITSEGEHKGRETWEEYEDICKLQTQS